MSTSDSKCIITLNYIWLWSQDEADLEEQYLSLGIDLDADDELVSSPIDDVDAFVFFRETLSALEAQHPEMVGN